MSSSRLSERARAFLAGLVLLALLTAVLVQHAAARPLGPPGVTAKGAGPGGGATGGPPMANRMSVNQP